MNENRHDIVWLTGGSGAGKTTLANLLQAEMTCVVLDGDEMRASISPGKVKRADKTCTEYWQ